MPNEWKRALEEYRYNVNLQDYERSENYPGYFNFSVEINDRCSTAMFENHFRESRSNIEAWIEVVFWKMYSQANRRTNVTNSVARYFEENNITAENLIDACNDYIINTTRNNLDRIRRLLGFSSPAVAVADTFPAFLRPDIFPMVDTRIAKWIGHCMDEHNNSDPNAPQLIGTSYLNTAATVLTLSDFDFILRWYEWCRYKADRLNEYTNIIWRARDVEMAVFHAWGNRNQAHPIIQLETIG